MEKIIIKDKSSKHLHCRNEKKGKIQTKEIPNVELQSLLRLT